MIKMSSVCFKVYVIVVASCLCLAVAGCGGGGGSSPSLPDPSSESTETPVIDEDESDSGEQELTLNQDNYVAYASSLFNSSALLGGVYGLAASLVSVYAITDMHAAGNFPETKACDVNGEEVRDVFQSVPFTISLGDGFRNTYSNCVEDAFVPDIEAIRNGATTPEETMIHYTRSLNGERSAKVLKNTDLLVLEMFTDITEVSTFGKGSTSITLGTMIVTFDEGMNRLTVESDRYESGSSVFTELYFSQGEGSLDWRYGIEQDGVLIKTTKPFVFPEGESYNKSSPSQGRMDVSTSDGRKLVVKVVDGSIGEVSVSYEGSITTLPWLAFITNLGG